MARSLRFASLALSLAITLQLSLLPSSTIAKPQQKLEENIRFSRLLNQKADLLRFTSISNLSPSEIENKFHRVYSSSNDKNAQDSIPLPVKPNKFSSSNSFSSRRGADPRIITRPEPGEEFVRIHQTVRRQDNFDDDNVHVEKNDESVTKINRRPVSGRTPVALLRQSSGSNRINISPVFPEIELSEKDQQLGLLQRNNKKNNQQQNRYSSSEETTINPNYVEENQETEYPTTQNYYNSEEVRATTSYPDSNLDFDDEKIKSKDLNVNSQSRMVVNVVTSVPRVVFDNVTRSRAIPSDVSKSDRENLVDSVNRQGSFPDFEDLPVNLAVAESSQPARVNVRPASSGKDYEYEYIYYYYDDDDQDGNSTSGIAKNKDSQSSVTPISTSTLPSTSLGVSQPAVLPVEKNTQQPSDRNQISDQSSFSDKLRESKSFQNHHVQNLQNIHIDNTNYPVSSNSNERENYDIEANDEVLQQTTAFPDLSRQTPSRNVVAGQPHNRPVILKQSNLINNHQILPVQREFTTPAPYSSSTEGQRYSPTTTERQLPQQQLPARDPTRINPSRFRNTNTPVKQPIELKQFVTNNQQQDLYDEIQQPQVINIPSEKRPTFKHNTRNNNQRRPQLAQQQPIEADYNQVYQQQPASPSIQSFEEVQAPVTRTRFPPRTTPTLTNPQQSINEPVYPTQTILNIQPQNSNSLNSNSNANTKSKEAFAREKSINDLYALTRLHQLAINTRIPNKRVEFEKNNQDIVKQPAFTLNGFKSEKASEEIVSNEVTTNAPLLPVVLSETAVTEAPTSSISPSTEAPEVPKFGRGRGRNPFRSRNQKTSSTTEGSPSSSTQNSRFNGRRRGFRPTQAIEASNPVHNEAVAPPEISRPITTRRPNLNLNKNRFAARSRPTTTTTTRASIDSEHLPSESPSAVSHTPASPTKRRINFQGRRRLTSNQNQITTSTPPQPPPQQQQLQQQQQSELDNINSPSKETSTKSAEPERKSRFHFNRPNARPSFGSGAVNPIAKSSGPRGRVSSPITPTTEAPEQSHQKEEILTEVRESVSEQVSPLIPQDNGDNEEKVSVSTSVSSTTTFSVEPPKRGSAGVLGRIRSRVKPVSTTTTEAPVVPERKQSRLNGILNRRKTTSTTNNPVEDNYEDQQQQQQQPQPQQESPNENSQQQQHNVVVQVSTSVTESEEVSESDPSEPIASSSTLRTSILRRSKAQRRPGTFFKKRSEHVPE